MLWKASINTSGQQRPLKKYLTEGLQKNVLSEVLLQVPQWTMQP
jgi:hypothetical protein